MRCLEAPLLTVGNSTAVAEDLLRNGGLSCPGCGGRLGGWGHAVSRRVFRAGRVPVSVRPRRARCGWCRATHVLLPAWVLARRCDGTAVIGDMLARAARGQGFRSIAAASGVPEDTVRAGCGGSAPRRGGCGSSSRGWPGRCRRIRCRWAGGQRPGGCGGGGRRGRGRGGGPVAGARGVGLGAGGGGHGGVASVPVRRLPRLSRLSRGPGTVCPGVTVQRELPSALAR